VLGRYEESEALLRKTLEGRQKLLGPEHDGTLMTVGEMAGVIGQQGRHGEAEQQFRDLVEMRERISGPDHPRTRSALRGHGLELMALGRYDEANEQLTLALDRQQRLEGDTHPDTLAYERSLARLRLAEGRPDEALLILERNVAAVRTASEDPLDLAEALMLSGEALQAVGRFNGSEAVLAEALALLEAALPEDHPNLARTRELLDVAR
jgi:tetratricopeptide (TPR) repeat protein